MTSTRPVLRGYLSDNSAGTSPEIMNAVAGINSGLTTPYGEDAHSASVYARFAEVFECPVDVFPVSTGSVANAISLAALTQPWGSILCHPDGHIDNDEAGAPEFFTNGAKIALVDGEDSKIDPERLRTAANRQRGDVHGVQPSVLSITQATETGSVYSLDELRALTDVARETGLRVQMDGARFANALVALDVSPAEMTWQLGVDILSFGATKNGAMTADAIVCFDPSLATELSFRHKRGGQLTSKMRFQTAQLGAYLADDLWLRNARQANEMAARIRAGLASVDSVDVLGDPTANILFCRFPDDLSAHLQAQGFGFYAERWELGVVRVVTSFEHTAEDIDVFVKAIQDFA